jgi:MFS family permease
LVAGKSTVLSLQGPTLTRFARRLAWNSTLFISAVFGLAAGASPNFYVLCVLLALNGIGTAGNMVLDGAVFLEFIPNTHKYLLTLLSVWWAVGQVVASLICWVFIAKYSCDTERVGIDGYRCDRNTNAGWRYSMYTLGAMMLFLWGLRFFILPMHESPKFLVSIGQDEEAVRVIHEVARKNGRTSSLTVDRL